MSALMQTYARLPVTFSHGEGVYLYDTDGRRYLDGISGIGVNALGHGHPAVTAAIREQADKLVHTSNLYRIEVQEPGQALIPADKLRQIVSAEDGDATLTLETSDDTLLIKGADAQFKVMGPPAGDFPPSPTNRQPTGPRTRSSSQPARWTT